MAKLPEAKVTFKAETEQFKNEMKSLNNENTRLRKEFRLQSAQMRDTATDAEKLEAKIEYLGKEQEITRKKIELTNQHLEKAKRVYGENSNEANKLANQLLDLQIKEQKLENSIQDTRQALSRQSQEMDETGKSADSLGTKLNNLGEKVSDVGDKLSMGLTAPFAAVGGLGVKSVMDLDGATRLLIGTMGATGKEAEILKNDLETLWRDGFGDNPEQVARAMLLVKQNIKGVNEGEELQKFTKDIMLLADATESDLGEATRGINQLMHNFGITAEEALDLFVQGTREGLNYSNEMFDNVAEYAPLFRDMGFSAEEYFSILTNGAQNGAYNLDYVNDIMKEFNIRVQDGSKTTEEAFDSLSKETQALFEEFKKGEATAEDLFRAVIPELENMEDQVRANQIGVDLFGTKFEDMGATTVYTLDDVNDSFKDTTGAMEEFAKIQEEAFGHKARRTFRNLMQAAEPAGEVLLELFDSAIPYIEKFSKWITDLDDDTKKFFLTLAGMGAVSGPALKTFGSITEIVSKLTDNVGKANHSIGSTNGFINLINKIPGPAGLVLTSIGLLAGGVALLTQNTEKSTEEIFNELEARQKQIEETDKLIERFELLKAKNQLSNDEMLRFMDIQNEIAKVRTHEEIAKLTDEQAQLLEKSGLTNEEMQEFLELNDKVIEQAPNTQKVISDEGNAYALNADAIKEVNEEKLRGLKIDAQKAMEDVISDENDLLKENKKLVSEINDLESQLQEKNKNRVQLKVEMLEKERILNDLQEEKNNLDADELVHHQSKIEAAQREYEIARDAYLAEEDKYLTTLEHLEAKNKTLEKNKEELAQLEQAKWQYEQIILATVDLNAEKGKGLETIQNEITRLQEEKGLLGELLRSGQLNTAEYQEQVRKIDEQIGRLEVAQSELQTMNDLAGKEIYKPIEIEENPKIGAFEKKLANKVRKGIEFYGLNSVSELIPKTALKVAVNFITKTPFFARGTDFAPGGPAILAEEGPELVREGNKWWIAPGIGIYDLKRGADVFTAEQTERILKGLTRLPAYADGVGLGRRLANISNNIGASLASTIQNKLNAHFNITVISELDGREVARNQYQYIKEIDDFETNRINRFRG